MPKNPIKFVNEVIDIIQLRFGIPAILRKFNNSHKAYEYIYKGEISTNNIVESIPIQEFLQM